MKILVLGSEGFIGRHCISYFQQKGDELYGCDLLDLKVLTYTYFKISRLSPGFDDIFIGTDFDVCINAAGSGSVPYSVNHPYADFEANTIDTFKLLDTIRLQNPSCKYINISSAAVYGNPQILPTNEDHLLKPLSPYGWHKYYGELICREYNQLYSIPNISVRPFSVFGPGLKKQLFWDLYQKSIRSDEIELFGTGTETRDFIYIGDLVHCLHLIIDNAVFDGSVYNLANGKATTIQNIAETFYSLLNPKLKIKFNGKSRAGDPNFWEADISRITSLGYQQTVSLEQGLLNYVLWLKEKN